jgi:hypothetical protein
MLAWLVDLRAASSIRARDRQDSLDHRAGHHPKGGPKTAQRSGDRVLVRRHLGAAFLARMQAQPGALVLRAHLAHRRSPFLSRQCRGDGLREFGLSVLEEVPIAH